MLSFWKGTGDADTNKKGVLWLILLAAGVGILLILIGGSAEESEATAPVVPYRTEEDEMVIYQRYLEEHIQTLCESVQGVSGVTVAVTLSEGFTSVWATEWKDGNEEYVILGSGASASALYLTRSAPTIAGVGIVCRGGGTERIRCELIALVSAAYHVNTNRIYVTESK